MSLDAIRFPSRVDRHLSVRRRTAGFTLIELLVTLAVVAILLGLAAPSFTAFQRNSELTSTANSFVAALSAARAEAMKRQINALVVPLVGTDWQSGWTVFVDVDNSVAVSNNFAVGATDIVVFKHVGMPTSVTVVAGGTIDSFTNGGNAYAMFTGSGFMRLTGGGFTTSALDLTNGTETRRIIANPAGRLRVCKPTDAGCKDADYTGL